MNRSLSYTLCCTFKIFESNAFPIKNHFSLNIDVSDMEVEENICNSNIFALKTQESWFPKYYTKNKNCLNQAIKYKRGFDFLLMAASNEISEH